MYQPEPVARLLETALKAVSAGANVIDFTRLAQEAGATLIDIAECELLLGSVLKGH